MEIDIKDKINEDFGNYSQTALDLTSDFEKELKLTPRVTRCVVYLAKGDISELKKMIKSAETDWRDVIMWAEATPFEFNNPFVLKS